MKIAVWHNLPSGGGKRALHQQVRGLVERGHEVESWTLSTADPSYLPLGDLVREHVVPFTMDEPAPRGTLRRLLGSSNTERRIARMHAACARCADGMRDRGVDVVFAASCGVFLTPYIGLHTGELPTVGYVQEPNRALYEVGEGDDAMLPWVADAGGPDPRARLRRVVTREFTARIAREEWRAVRALDRLLVNSQFSRESFLRAYGADAKVCYLGIDTAMFVDRGLPRERFVVGVGSFHAIKGIDLAVRAVALLPVPRPPLVWIGNSGDAAYEAQVTALAERLGVDLQPRRRVSDAELVDLLNRASAMLYTSRLEPFGLAPLEANACGTPVVAVAEGGVRESVVDGVNGHLADDRDPAQLAAALDRLLASPAHARALGRRGAELVRERWTVPQSVARVERHLLQAAGRES